MMPETTERRRWFREAHTAAPTLPTWFLLTVAELLADASVGADA